MEITKSKAVASSFILHSNSQLHQLQDSENFVNRSSRKRMRLPVSIYCVIILYIAWIFLN